MIDRRQGERRKTAAQRSREWRRKNPEKRKADNERRRKRRDNRSKVRWKMIWHWVYTRCHCKSWTAENYRDRGIECRITVLDIARAWFRDVAWMMRRPCLDRIDPDGHYEVANIRFIEEKENLERRRPWGTVPDGEREPGMEG